MTLPAVETAVALAADATSDAHRDVIVRLIPQHNGAPVASVFPHPDGGARVLLSTAGPLPGAILTADLTPDVFETRETMLRALLAPHLDAPCTCDADLGFVGCRPCDTEAAISAVLDGS